MITFLEMLSATQFLVLINNDNFHLTINLEKKKGGGGYL